MNIRQLLAVPAIAVLALIGAPVAAQAAPTATPAETVVAPKIRTLPVAIYSASKDRTYVVVRYQCTNTSNMRSYLELSMEQSGSPVYNAGLRNDSPGILITAQCTGKWVTQTLALVRGSFDVPPYDGYPRTGQAKFSFAITQRDAQVWYIFRGPGAFTSHNVLLVRTR
jgi:hypothetical protein